MKKVVIIVLVAVAVLAVVVLAARPGGSSDSVRPPAFVDLIDSVTPKTKVRAADVAGQSCWDDFGAITVAAGTGCRTQLPERANQLRICITAGAPQLLRIQGAKFAPQEVDLRGLGCDADPRIRLYDENSTMIIACSPGSPPCRLELR